MPRSPLFMRLAPLGAILAILLSTSPAGAAAAKTPCPDLKIALDIGHFMEKPGAISARGLAEIYFNADLTAEIKEALHRDGFTQVRIINHDGRIQSLVERSRIANEAGDDIFLSIHHDSMQEHFLKEWIYEDRTLRYGDQFSGFSLFISRKNPQLKDSTRLAKLIGRHLVGAGFQRTLHHAADIPGERKPLVDRKHGVHYYDNLVVLKTTRMPAVLIEGGVILNREEELRIRRSPDYHRRFARSVSRAVMDYCKK